MIIDILTDTILNTLPNNNISTEGEITDIHAGSKELSYTSIIAKYKLDFKQSVAFEIMASSFILSSLLIEKISEEAIQTFFENNTEDSMKYTNCLSQLKKDMKAKGGEDKLVMFLSGMGGTGKSEVIKAFVYFAKGFC